MECFNNKTLVLGRKIVKLNIYLYSKSCEQLLTKGFQHLMIRWTSVTREHVMCFAIDICVVCLLLILHLTNIQLISTKNLPLHLQNA